MRSGSLLIFIILCIYTPARAGFDFNERCRKAYRHILTHEIIEARELLSLEQAMNPSNKIPLYLEHYLFFIDLAINEDLDIYDKYRKERDQRLRAISRDREESPWKRFTQADILIQSSLIRLKAGEFLAASSDIQKAYRLLIENQNLYPEFLLNQKSLLPIQAMLGVIPENYNWLVKFLGFDGDLRGAVTSYEQLIPRLEENPEFSIFARESKIILSYIYLHLMNMEESAWEMQDMPTSDYIENPISAFIRANLAQRLKKNDEVIKVLQHHVNSDPVIPHLDYLMGNALLYRLEDKSRKYFARYLKNFKGESYRKDALLKIAWAYMLKNDTDNYSRCSLLVQQIGNTTREEDKQAVDELSWMDYPDVNLLKARLLFDGGYLTLAKNLLQEMNQEKMPLEGRAEYHYRLARVLHEQRNLDEALFQYKQAQQYPASGRSYFVPASCYFAGIIHEQQNQREKAAVYFRKCLSFKDYSYKNSFDQRANAALRRMGMK